MHIEISQTGGVAYFPGLSKPEALDVGQLPEIEQVELRRLVDASHFFNLPECLGTPHRGAADYQYYIVKIVDGQQQRTVRAIIPVEDKALDELILKIRKYIKAMATPPNRDDN